jgi:glycosyltransferase involved in cell wall biosynthesis
VKSRQKDCGPKQSVNAERPDARPRAVRKLAILMITARYAPEIGGTEIHTQELAERLVQRGHQVTVLTTDRTGDLPALEVVEGVQVRRVRAWPHGRDYYFAPSMVSQSRSSRFDLVHIQGVHTLVAPLGYIVARKLGVPFVLAFHSGGHSSRWRSAIRGPQFRALRPFLGRANCLVANSTYEKEYFRTAFHIDADKITVIPIGSNLKGDDEADHHDHQGPLVLSVGRLERYKGHHRLIEAWPHVLQLFPNSQLQIVGEGAFQPGLETLIGHLDLAESIKIGAIPSTDRKRMARQMKRASLIVSLSEFESSGMAIREALALGTPALLSDIPGFRDLADSSQVTMVPREINAIQLATTIVRCLQSQRLEPPRDAPTWEQCVDDFEAVYRTALTSRR